MVEISTASPAPEALTLECKSHARQWTTNYKELKRRGTLNQVEEFQIILLNQCRRELNLDKELETNGLSAMRLPNVNSLVFLGEGDTKLSNAEVKRTGIHIISIFPNITRLEYFLSRDRGPAPGIANYCPASAPRSSPRSKSWCRLWSAGRFPTCDSSRHSPASPLSINLCGPIAWSRYPRRATATRLMGAFGDNAQFLRICDNPRALTRVSSLIHTDPRPSARSYSADAGSLYGARMLGIEYPLPETINWSWMIIADPKSIAHMVGQLPALMTLVLECFSMNRDDLLISDRNEHFGDQAYTFELMRGLDLDGLVYLVGRLPSLVSLGVDKEMVDIPKRDDVSVHTFSSYIAAID
ncbi:hypothetical protein DL89DRAFT_265763 [Linderina pennispora]|uniref:Uncharacterized protein n=1 Tax=Linderina pennispora TaxID=61395 RepID=A0A1Y1WF02_9FUNG|nr:uncharacterized protein DL89DRAFT_265763 [Linderina pennispora]ORX72121.1 hypothetical protein DL89DRAFT_265763 [Linderina pennispora]